MPYRLIENTPDTAAEIEATTLEDLFSLCCHAWRDTSIELVDSPSTDVKFIYFNSSSLQNLLAMLLEELNKMLVNNNWVFNSVEELKITSEDSEYSVYADLFGEQFNPDLHKIKRRISSIVVDKIEMNTGKEFYSAKIIFAF